MPIAPPPTCLAPAVTSRPKAWQAKLNWRMIRRASPPKRRASSRQRDFREIYFLFSEAAIQEQASRCIQCVQPFCRTGCPLANRIPEWLALAADGKFLEAAEVSQSTSNMPEICSRVCPQEKLCEGACILNARSEPVAIGAVEKFINEYAFAHGTPDTTVATPNGAAVAVVGAGPAGLACADELAKLGYAVTVFEALEEAGGLLVYGIPAFKLEKSIVRRRIDVMARRGIRFRTGARLGDQISLADLRRDFEAVFLGIGAQKPKALDVPGGDAIGVFDAIPFLVQKNVGTSAGLAPIQVEGKSVAVLGGGDTAMDCLRTAIRSGAGDARCLYRRDEANMPGSKKEYFNALEEGAIFEFLTAPVRLEVNAANQVTGVWCQRMELGAPDASGRRRPRPIPGSEFLVTAEVVLVAYGFDPVPFPKTSNEFAGLLLDSSGCIIVDKNQMTSLPGVFSGGDLVRGPSLVVHAVRDGRQAAAGIDRYFANRGS